MKHTVTRPLLCATIALALFGCGGNTPQDPAQSSGSTALTEPAAPVDDAPVATAAAAAASNASADAAPHPGEATYQKTCAMCHGSPAMGAPVLGNKGDWAPRIANGMDTLYLHATEGYVGEKGAMPARGGNPGLDDETVKIAVDFMVAKAQ